MVYQYAVIVRPYTLLPLLAFFAAFLFKDVEHPERMTLVLVLLANLSLHRTIQAGCLGLVYLMDAYRVRARLDARVRRRYWICIGVMAAVFVFIVLILRPTPDIEEFVLKRQFAQLPPDVQAQAQIPTVPRKLTTVISGGFLDWIVPSVVFLALTAGWFLIRRRFILFALPVGAMIAFYAKIHGAAHHHGTAFVAALTALWIAWPTIMERKAFDTVQRRALQGMTALLLCLCAINICDSAVVIEREYLYPYSGAQDAASYLKSVGADHGPMFGFLFGVVAVQASSTTTCSRTCRPRTFITACALRYQSQYG
jgi:hypothetical protein